MKISELRRLNLATLIKKHGSQRGFADRIELAPSYISQLAVGTRNIGENTARKIEEKLNLDDGWFDKAHFQDIDGDYTLMQVNSDELQLLELYRGIPDNMKVLILTMAKETLEMGFDKKEPEIV